MRTQHTHAFVCRAHLHCAAIKDRKEDNTNRQSLGPILGRVVTVIAVLLLTGLVLRLVVAILDPVLPDQFMGDVMSGWNMLYSMVSPAMPPIMAVAILCALCWVIAGKRR